MSFVVDAIEVDVGRLLVREGSVGRATAEVRPALINIASASLLPLFDILGTCPSNPCRVLCRLSVVLKLLIILLELLTQATIAWFMW